MKRVARETLNMILNMEKSMEKHYTRETLDQEIEDRRLDAISDKTMHTISKQAVILQTVSIVNCSSCNASHENLPVSMLTTPVEGYNFYTNCPFTNKVVYIRYIMQ